MLASSSAGALTEAIRHNSGTSIYMRNRSFNCRGFGCVPCGVSFSRACRFSVPTARRERRWPAPKCDPRLLRTAAAASPARFFVPAQAPESSVSPISPCPAQRPLEVLVYGGHCTGRARDIVEGEIGGVIIVNNDADQIAL